MKILLYPSQTELDEALKRPSGGSSEIELQVREIIHKVKKEGDKALRYFSERFDGSSPHSFKIDDAIIKNAADEIPEDLKKAVRSAAANIEAFHAAGHTEPVVTETSHGVRCWSRDTAIEKVGLYIPGGTAPLFSTVLMLAIPARLAGCSEIIMCTPPGRDSKINPLILYAASLSGVCAVYCVGGAQAIAAMAYGTESVPSVFKIFGPGNRYVTRAKELVQLDGVSIDMPAGPSELMVIADESANPVFVAADLLSQAEHGPDSQVIMLTCDKTLIEKVEREMENQLSLLDRKGIALEALGNSFVILLDTIDSCISVSNRYAPEHLIIATRDPYKDSSGVVNAGSVFLGHFSSESAGDYMSGPNHTLPTGGYARSLGGISVTSFTKRIFFQEVTETGILEIGPDTEMLAGAEKLTGHANAITVRLKYLRDEKNT
jgi:histidinol dehydrogenase